MSKKEFKQIKDTTLIADTFKIFADNMRIVEESHKEWLKKSEALLVEQRKRFDELFEKIAVANETSD